MTEAEFLRIIEENGGKLYIAGGFVRDELMGKNPHDKDYVITGFSEEKFSSLFSNKKNRRKISRIPPVYRPCFIRSCPCKARKKIGRRL